MPAYINLMPIYMKEIIGQSPNEKISHPNSLLAQIFFPYTKPSYSTSCITFQKHNLIENIYKSENKKMN